PAQTVQASYINNATEQANVSPLSAAALLDAGMLTTRQLPNRLFGVNYNGQLTPSLFATVQFSDKYQGFRHNGGTSSNIVDSPFVTTGATAGVPGNLYYHAPYLDATDPSSRTNSKPPAARPILRPRPATAA